MKSEYILENKPSKEGVYSREMRVVSEGEFSVQAVGAPDVSSQKHTYDTSDNSKKELIDKPKQSFLGLKFSGNYSNLAFFSFFSSFRSSLVQRFSTFFPPNYTVLFVGMILGGKDGFDVVTQQQLKNVGIQHVVSASGYNISLLLSFFDPLLSKVKRKRVSFVVTLMLLFLFLVVSGFSVSLLRAAIMTGLSLLSRNISRRQYHPLYILCSTAALFLLLDIVLLGELSFLLTFAATLGIMLFGFSQPSDPSPTVIAQGISFLKENFQTTLAAQFFTFPIIWYFIGQVSLVGLISNVFFLILTPLLTTGVVVHMLLQYIPLLQYLSAGFLWMGGNIFFLLLHFFDHWSVFLNFRPPSLSLGGLLAWWSGGILWYRFFARRKELRVY